MIIAIDGPVASGKSTTARRVAERLGYTFFDTGLTYRGLAYALLKHGVDPTDPAAVVRQAESVSMTLRPVHRAVRVYLDGEDVTDRLWTPDVADVSSKIAGIPAVRALLVERQRQAVGNGNTVVAGRDIGTVVFPEAAIKLYLDADAAIRARRRHAELIGRGERVTLEQVHQDILERDRRDTGRSDSPLRCAEDAVHLDTSAMTLDEQVERILALAVTRISAG